MFRVKCLRSLVFVALLILPITSAGHALASDPAVPAPNAEVRDEASTVHTQGYRSGRGGFSGVRPPTNRGGAVTTPGAPRSPVRNPAATTPVGRGWGGMIGGFALGTLLGSLFNPLGFLGFGPGAG